jgi:hypothetical protein
MSLYNAIVRETPLISVSDHYSGIAIIETSYSLKSINKYIDGHNLDHPRNTRVEVELEIFNVNVIT